MKTRVGFVSNSSSSSFIIARTYLTNEQLEKIINHMDYFDDGRPYSEEEDPYLDDEYCTHKCDGWYINVSDTYVKGNVTMDNFSMQLFLQAIGVKDDAIEWFDGHW